MIYSCVNDGVDWRWHKKYLTLEAEWNTKGRIDALISALLRIQAYCSVFYISCVYLYLAIAYSFLIQERSEKIYKTDKKHENLCWQQPGLYFIYQPKAHRIDWSPWENQFVFKKIRQPEAQVR